MPEPWFAEESVPCLDTECPGGMEPEEDGDHRYWACATCGYEAGFQKVQSSTTMCAAGVLPQPLPPAEQPWADPDHDVIGDIRAVDRWLRADPPRTETGWAPVELGMPGRRSD